MRMITRFALPSIFLIAWAATSVAQSLPTSQPDVLFIIIEEIKLGHGSAHTATEAGWPAAYGRAKSSFSYLAFESMTGTPQVWFVSPFDSHAQMAESFKEESDNTELSAELSRLQRADAEHLTGLHSIHAVARKELSHGAFPDAATQRFWEVTTLRVRPGGEPAFEAGAKAYGEAAGRAAPDTAYRVYQVAAGMPGPTYLIFGSHASFAAFDDVMPSGVAIMKAMNPQEQEAMEKFMQVIVDAETNRFSLDPNMSYVSQEVKEQDPAFWMSKK